jgi:glycosyltransferase involved in cell wall biosynthesis
MLRECQLSVAAQTEPAEVYEHLILVDDERKGCAWAMNQLAARARGYWLLPLADDDLILPGCLTALLNRSSEGDIIYSPPFVSMNGDGHFWGVPPQIPSFALIRRDLWMSLGGYDESLIREEDRRLWTKALEQGATFVRIPEPLWVYRFHGGNKSYHRGIAA